jgi:hypothetical protein
MLKVKGMRDVSPGKRVFVIEENGESASAESIGRVAAIAQKLLQENDLPGEFHVFEAGLLGLNVPLNDRTFFHDGIVFAALDAVNDPGKNPTISQLAIGG